MRGLFPLTKQMDVRLLRKTSDFFGRLRTSSGIFGNDCVVLKNPSTPRIKISRLYFGISWQVYLQSYWRPTGRNFGAPKNMGGLCFQVLGSLGVFGGLRGLRGLCFQDTRATPLNRRGIYCDE